MSLASLATRVRKLELAAQKKRQARQEGVTIRYWIDFILYCSDTPEAERRFGDTLRTGPIFHPKIKPFFDQFVDNESEITP